MPTDPLAALTNALTGLPAYGPAAPEFGDSTCDLDLPVGAGADSQHTGTRLSPTPLSPDSQADSDDGACVSQRGIGETLVALYRLAHRAPHDPGCVRAGTEHPSQPSGPGQSEDAATPSPGAGSRGCGVCADLFEAARLVPGTSRTHVRLAAATQMADQVVDAELPTLVRVMVVAEHTGRAGAMKPAAKLHRLVGELVPLPGAHGARDVGRGRARCGTSLFHAKELEVLLDGGERPLAGMNVCRNCFR